jgi:hypothetical protein
MSADPRNRIRLRVTLPLPCGPASYGIAYHTLRQALAPFGRFDAQPVRQKALVPTLEFEIQAPGARAPELQRACERAIRQVGHPEFPAHAIRLGPDGTLAASWDIATRLTTTPCLPTEAPTLYPAALPLAA